MYTSIVIVETQLFISRLFSMLSKKPISNCFTAVAHVATCLNAHHSSALMIPLNLKSPFSFHLRCDCGSHMCILNTEGLQ